MMYLVRICKKSIGVEVLGLHRDVDLSWTDNMIGAMPIFDDYDSALAYANGDESLLMEVRETK